MPTRLRAGQVTPTPASAPLPLADLAPDSALDGAVMTFDAGTAQWGPVGGEPAAIVQHVAGAVNGTSFDLVLPAPLTPGNFLIAVASSRAGHAPVIVNNDAGHTLVSQHSLNTGAEGAFNEVLNILAYTIVSGDGQTWHVDNSGGGSVYACALMEIDSAYDPTGYTYADTSVSGGAGPAITAVTAALHIPVLVCCGPSDDGGNWDGTAGPTNYTMVEQVGTNPGVFVGSAKGTGVAVNYTTTVPTFAGNISQVAVTLA